MRKRTIITSALAIPALFCLSVMAADAAWVSNTLTGEASGDDVIIGGTDTADDVILGGIDTDTGVIIGGTDTAVPDPLPGAGTHPVIPKVETRTPEHKVQGVFGPGGWGVLPGLGEGVYMLTGETQGEFTSDSLGAFSPGGWGLEGVDVDTYSGEPPGGFELLWRGVTETVSLALTFDPVKKAEKRLEFAEERMNIAANLAADADDPKVQKRIEQSVQKAQKFLGDIEKTQDKWFDAQSQRSQQLLGNIVRHQLNREGVMDKLEAKLPEDRLDNIRQFRQEGLEGSGRLLNAISNENIPSDVKDHLEDLKTQIDGHAQEIRDFRDQKKSLNTVGDDAQLRQLQDERRQRLDLRNNAQMQMQHVPLQQGGAMPPATDEFGRGVHMMEWQVKGAEAPAWPPVIDGATGVSPDVIDPVNRPPRVSPDVIDPIGGAGQAEEPPMETIYR